MLKRLETGDDRTMSSTSLPKTEKKHSLWIRGMLFIFLTLSGAVLLGWGWRDDSLAWLGVLGFGVFLYGQFRFRNLFLCLLQAVVTGYLGYLIANPWMQWTLEGIFQTQSPRVTGIVHGVHLFHAGIYCSFAIGWWASRKFLRSGWLLAPAIWLICEAVFPCMYPMRHGCLLLGVNPLVQIGSVFGVMGATLQFVAIASLLPLGLCWLHRSTPEISSITARNWIVGIVVFTLLNFSWGSFRIHQLEQQSAAFSGDYLNVGMVQGETEHAQFHYEFVKRTRELGKTCELVLWPECSLGRYNRKLTDFSNQMLVTRYSYGIGYQFQPFPDPNCHLLAAGYSWTPKPGISDYDKLELEEKYVSAYLFDLDEQMAGRHDKVKLMAGGEYVPYEEQIPALGAWLRDVDDLSTMKLSKGPEPKPIGEVKDIAIGVMLCCEDMYAEVGRDLTRNGSDLLVCLANGMTFNSEIVLQQHFNISRFRAIENNRYFARCGSYGVSCLIAPSGEILQSEPCFEEVDLRLKIPIEERSSTWFTKMGDTLTAGSYVCVLAFILFSCVSWLLPKSTQQPIEKTT